MRSKVIEEYKAGLRFSSVQREVLIGLMLGDGNLESANRGRTYRLKIEHSLSQRDYLEHLYSLFKEWVLTPPRVREFVVKDKIYRHLVFSTLSHASFRFYAHQFYRNGKKVVPKLIHRWLTPMALTYWYMDDGSMKSRESKGVIFNTQGFDRQDVNRLIVALRRNFQLEVKDRKQREGYQIYVSGKSYEKFSELVSPYLIDSMKYKMPVARQTFLPKE